MCACTQQLGENNGFEGRRWGQGGEMAQALYAHMNNKIIFKKSEKERK
jgi:hypothetical protein